MMRGYHLSPCGEIVRRHDPDRFLICLFAAESQREALFALFAFNYEIAKVNSTVSEPILGQIRLQWWREAIEECFEKNVQRLHEVVQPLFIAITKFKLTRAYFDMLIDARERDLDQEKFKSIGDLSDYAAQTNGPLMWLSCEIFDKKSDDIKQIAKILGTAWAMIGLMRATPFLIPTGKDALPREILKTHGLNAAPNGPSSEITATVKDICLNVEHKINICAVDKVDFCPPLLLKILANQYLAQFKKVKYDPFDGRMATPPFARIVKLYLASFLKRL